MGAKCTRDTGGLGAPSNSDDDDEPISPLLQLNDDVILCILSYVSYAPFERDISGTLALVAVNNPTPQTPQETEVKRLVEDYNGGATRLNKKLRRGSSISPFQSAQYYYMEAFHGDANANDNSLARLSSFKTFGTLTHLLPLVCKQFRTFCNESDVLWTEALERLMGVTGLDSKRSDIGSSLQWEQGILSLIRSHSDETEENGTAATEPDETNGTNNDSNSLDENERVCDLISKACECVGEQPEQRQQASSSVAREVYRQVLTQHKPICLPVFKMFYPMVIGEEVNLRLFEPRYRLLITEIMAGRPEQESNGYPLATPRPRFLFACRGDTWQDTVGCIVEVRRCLVRRQDGVVGITIVPVSWNIIDKLQTRPESGELLDGTVSQSPNRRRLPAFCMRTHLIAGESIRLRLREERYRRLVSEVMVGRTREEKSGGHVAEPRPQFIFVCNNRFREGDVAWLVDVERCQINDDGSARVTVAPRECVLVESVKVRPKSGNLYDASVIYPLQQTTIRQE